jgi:hypothetical protein
MSIKASIVIDNTPLDILFSYYAGEKATRDYPGCPEEYEVDRVYIRNSIYDIYPALSEEYVKRIVKELEKQKGEI